MSKEQNQPWTTSRTDLDSYTLNPETGKTEHVVYVYRGDGEDEQQRIAVFGTRNRDDAELIASAVNNSRAK